MTMCSLLSPAAVARRLSHGFKATLRCGRTALAPAASGARCCHGDKTKTNKTTLRKEKEKFRGYILSRYMEYVTNYKKLLEVRFPSAMNMYRIFSVGLKDFYKDLKLYIPQRIRSPLTEKNIVKFTRQEIELYYKMPRDMWKIAPVLILSAVPFGNYVIFPLALLKPRLLLTSHFWSMQQKAEFSVIDLQKRLSHNKAVFRALASELDQIEDTKTKEGWRKILALLGSGVHPKSQQLLQFKQLFADKPYHLKNLGYLHVSQLLGMHSLHRGLFRRKRLHRRAFLIFHLDRAILREGGPERLSVECLKSACLLRGLNSTHLSRPDMETWLQQWLDVSRELDRDTYSLLLHCPLLLACNHPQNWKLLI